MTTGLPFTLIAPDLATGAARDGWQPITGAPLLILVGVTGVGKSTLLAQEPIVAANFAVLPDRRDLTDRLIIPLMQAHAGDPPGPVTDRRQRFAYTRAYREHYPGGMAHALTQLLVPQVAGRLRLFDGLRGANEVTYAAQALPLARFVMLDASDAIRVRRLLGRGDSFDRIETDAAADAAAAAPASFAALGVDGAAGLFTPDEQRSLLALVEHGEVSAGDLAAKLSIVVEERRNYDPAATCAALLAHAPARSLILDTAAAPADVLAVRLAAWLDHA